MADVKPQIKQLNDTRENRKIFRYFDAKLGDWEKVLDPTLIKPKLTYNNIPKVLQSTDCRVLVAYVGTRTAGYIVGKLLKSAKWYGGRKYGYIECLYVEEEFRNRGLAHALFSNLHVWFENKKIKKIKLRVFANNDKAIERYEQWGFKTKVIEMVLEK